jgi:undecaprenyl diphosphate synthase
VSRNQLTRTLIGAEEIETIPRHIAIIMDGNGRWARRRGLPRIMGHRQGVKAVRSIVTACREFGVQVLTLYAFSQENWRRPSDEVNALMDLLYGYLKSELETMLGNQIALRSIGEIGLLPERVRECLEETVEKTSGNTGMVLNLALSYGSRAEIAKAARRMAERCLAGTLTPEEIDEDQLAAHLDTAGLPDPDLLIRTSGEWRLSNFLLFQAAYCEIFVTSTLWPDFDRDELLIALRDYQKRERRFGLTSEQLVEPCTTKGS